MKPASLLAASEYGRMTKGIAQMYMLKLYMHEAGQERHYRNDEGKAMMWWNRVDSITEVMIKDGEYSLQKDYMSIWSPSNQRNSEVIFPDTQFPRRRFRKLFPRTCITRRLCIAKRNSTD